MVSEPAVKSNNRLANRRIRRHHWPPRESGHEIDIVHGEHVGRIGSVIDNRQQWATSTGNQWYVSPDIVGISLDERLDRSRSTSN